MKQVFIAVLFDEHKQPVAYTNEADSYEEGVEFGAQGLDDIEAAQYFQVEKYYTKGAKA